MMNRWTKRTCVLACCFLLPGVRAEASAQDVILTAKENKVEVTVGALDEDAYSMQLALDVKVTEGNADTKISFEFAPGIAGSVKQYRYDQDTGTLNIYISGGQDQKLSKDQELGIGKVVVDAGTGSASATVDVRQGSLQIVNDAYDLYRFAEINASPTQKVTVGESSTETPSPEPGEKEEPSEAPDSSQGSSSGSSPGSSSGSSSGGASPTPAGSGSVVPPDRIKPGRTVKVRPVSSSSGSEDAPEEAGEELKDQELLEDPAAEDPWEEPAPEDGTLPEEPADDSGKDTSVGDGILLGVLAAAAAAAGVVVFLMVQEYGRRKKTLEGKARRQEKPDRKKKRKTHKDQP